MGNIKKYMTIIWDCNLSVYVDDESGTLLLTSAREFYQGSLDAWLLTPAHKMFFVY
ncbi:MAG: hypothetical protein ACI9LM_001927 [Alteromonadaceae bacterium]|jgi:hypothetical protein